MNDATHTQIRPLADTSPSAIVAGFIAMMTGYTSSLVLMFQAGQAAGLSSGQISSWIWAISIGMAVCSIGLSLRYRTPITIAWSTPGAALLITSLGGVSYGEAIGAYITCAVLVTICGLTGSFERLVKKIPAALVLGMFVTYLVVKRLSPRYAVLAALLIGTALSGFMGLLDFSDFHLEVATPVWTTPHFSLAATISIGIPLFVVAMTSQNMPGIAVLRADGYTVPASPLITTTGIASLLLAPFGSHGINLAAISAAICTGPHAHEDRNKRYTAAVWCGIFYGIAGVFGATLAALFAALPKELVLSIAALALFGSIINGLSIAMSEVKEREAALITFMVTASGLTLFSIGSAFWGIVAGVVTLLILNWRSEPARDGRQR
jgi:benzoate membrane transport protein